MMGEGRIPENHLDGEGQPLDMAVIEGLRGMGVKVEHFFDGQHPTNRQLAALYDGLVKLRRVYPDAPGAGTPVTDLDAFRDLTTIHRFIKEADEWFASNGLAVDKVNSEKWLRQKFTEVPAKDDVVSVFVHVKMRRMDKEDAGLFSASCKRCGVIVHKVNKAEARFQAADHNLVCGLYFLEIVPSSMVDADARMVDGSKCCDDSRGMQA